MERRFASVEIIPIDGPSFNANSKPVQAGKMNNSPFYDPLIVSRVERYLEENVDKTYVDISIMADDLQRRYKEYTRRKRSAFKRTVKRAYAAVMQAYGSNHITQDSSSENSLDCEDGTQAGQAQQSRDPLLAMYSNQSKRTNNHPLAEDSELIDISSDEETVFVDGANNGPNNGASIDDPPYLLQPPSNSSSPGLAEKPGRKRKLASPPPQDVARAGVSKKKKAEAESSQVVPITFKDLGGIERVLKDVCRLLVHIKHPEVYRQIGISPPTGFLLHGPPGCGKTLLANAIAGELDVPLIKVAAPELVAGVSGESEERIRGLFESATKAAPCVLFIDEIDAITPNRQQAQREMERRIVAQILSCLDDLSKSDQDQVLVIGATNRPDSLDPALRRAGRFDREVCLGIPDTDAREDILRKLASKLKLADDFDYRKIAKNTPGFVGADLMSLIREAAIAAVNRVFMELKQKQPSLKRSSDNKTEQKKSDEVSEIIVVEAETQKETVTAVNGTSEPQQSKSEQPIEVSVASTQTEECTAEAVEASKEAHEDTLKSTEAADEPMKAADEPMKSDEPMKADDPMKADEIPMKADEPASSAPSSAVDTPTPPTAAPCLQITLEDLKGWLVGMAPLTQQQLEELCVTMGDFEAALKVVQPSAKREGFATVPDVTWDDVGSLKDIREELQMTIMAPVKHAEQFTALGLNTPTGVLLCGPPGCGKTLLAKAIANEAGINFLSVKGPELLNMYVGESERAVRLCFQRARNSSPCVIFFDEIDALCPKRSDVGENAASMRVVNQMLTEMDGVEGRKGVFLMAASNRPDIIDPAVLRPGRLDKILFVGLPTPSDRVDILRAITKNGTKPLLAPDVDLETIGKSIQCDNYTGADMAALVREAGVTALKEYISSGGTGEISVATAHFNAAVAKIRPSVTEKDLVKYEEMRRAYGQTLLLGNEEAMEYS